MQRENAAWGDDAPASVRQLLEVAEIDTIYRDLYWQRARTVLAPILPYEEYLRAQQEQSTLAKYLQQSRLAIEQGDWQRVKELGDRVRVLRDHGHDKGALLTLAHSLYGGADVPIDPFSPVFPTHSAKSGGDLVGTQERVVKHLTALEKTDPSWQAFYASRRSFFLHLALDASATDPAGPRLDPHHIQQEALFALEKGDMGKLAHLAQTMLHPLRAARAALPRVRTAAPTDLSVPFAAATLSRAARLGLAPAQVEPTPELSEHLFRHAWHPAGSDRQTAQQGRTLLEEQSYPPGTPAALKETLDLFMLHPFISSGGTRYLPRLVAEDVLVENFPEPEEEDEVPTSALLTALGLTRRRALSRVAIEQALLARGPQIVQDELALDPQEFCLLCIPADLYLRLGSAYGWGRQRTWTHFDGYQVLKDGRLRALAGGDVRYGGLYDLLGISRTDEQERVIVRFAVVRRARLMAA
jgi:hypothetical protein